MEVRREDLLLHDVIDTPIVIQGKGCTLFCHLKGNSPDDELILSNCAILRFVAARLSLGSISSFFPIIPSTVNRVM
jgi:hypothetical protein